ncbi:MAG: insulinase family protein, partial [Armatimonadetes bacterium]|nr:insulinase family protein [Armatimonadota bacterium]
MFALPDGVRILLRPDPAASGVGIALLVRTGAPRTAAQAATAAVVARGLLYGSVNASYDEFARGMHEVGGSVRTVVGYDFAGVELLTGKSQLPDAIYLLCEAVKNARFTNRTISRVVAAEGMPPVSPDPLGDLFRVTTDVHIDRTALAAVTPAAAELWFERRYAAARTVICLCGDFDEAVVKGLLADRLYDFLRPAAAIPDSPASPQQTPAVRRIADHSNASGAAATVESAITPNCSFADLLALAALLG